MEKRFNLERKNRKTKISAVKLAICRELWYNNVDIL